MARRILEFDPDSAQAFLHLSRIYRNQGEYEQAVQAALSALGVQVGNSRVHFLLGQHKFFQTHQAFQNCLALVPDDCAGYRILSRVAFRLGDFEQFSEDEATQRSAVQRLRLQQQERSRVRAQAEVRQADRDVIDR